MVPVGNVLKMTAGVWVAIRGEMQCIVHRPAHPMLLSEFPYFEVSCEGEVPQIFPRHLHHPCAEVFLLRRELHGRPRPQVFTTRARGGGGVLIGEEGVAAIFVFADDLATIVPSASVLDAK